MRDKGLVTLYPLSHVYSRDVSGTAVDSRIKAVLLEENPDLRAILTRGDVVMMQFNAAVKKLKKQLDELSSGDTTLPYSDNDEVVLTITKDQVFPALQAGFERIISQCMSVSVDRAVKQLSRSPALSSLPFKLRSVQITGCSIKLPIFRSILDECVHKYLPSTSSEELSHNQLQ